MKNKIAGICIASILLSGLTFASDLYEEDLFVYEDEPETELAYEEEQDSYVDDLIVWIPDSDDASFDNTDSELIISDELEDVYPDAEEATEFILSYESNADVLLLASEDDDTLVSEADSDFDYEFIDEAAGEIAITGYHGTDTELIIPPVIGDYTVTAIGAGAFKDNDLITKVTISDGISIIEEEAFADCSSLEKITLYSVTTIKARAFKDCINLKSIESLNNEEHEEPDEPPHVHTWNEEYTIDQEPTCTEEGSKSIHCTECDEIKEGTRESIPAAGHQWNDGVVTTKASTSVTGKITITCEACGEETTKNIPRAYVTLSRTEYTYNAKVRSPKVYVRTKSGNDISAGYYTVTYENASSKNAGTYTVTVNLKGNYSGTKTLSYKINKAANKITKVTSAKTIKYSKLKSGKQTFNIAATVKGKAKKTFTLSSVPSKAKKYITVSKAGKVTVKKGLAKGTYKIKVKIAAAATKNYKAKSVTKTVTITVK